MNSVVLNNGVVMPMYGLGLSHNGGGDYSKAIDVSLNKGVRLFDTASRYRTEEILGERIQNAFGDSVLNSLNEAFVTTKLWPGDCEDVAGACAASLNRLGRDCIDLYLIHWPGLSNESSIASRVRQDTWRQMECLLESGKCRAIGVSNFLETHLHDLEETWSVCPQVNQIELNPLQYRKNLLQCCCDMNIQVEGYCPLGKGALLSNRNINTMAEKYHCTAAQLCIAWSLHHDVVTIPKSTSRNHIISNLDAVSLTIREDDMAFLDSLDSDLRCTWNPVNVK